MSSGVRPSIVRPSLQWPPPPTQIRSLARSVIVFLFYRVSQRLVSKGSPCRVTTDRPLRRSYWVSDVFFSAEFAISFCHRSSDRVLEAVGQRRGPAFCCVETDRFHVTNCWPDLTDWWQLPAFFTEFLALAEGAARLLLVHANRSVSELLLLLLLLLLLVLVFDSNWIFIISVVIFLFGTPELLFFFCRKWRPTTCHSSDGGTT